MPRDPHEHIISSRMTGIYESNYLKANSPDGRYGLWLKHNLLRPAAGPGIGEFWFILSRPDGPPVVAKREVDLHEVTLSDERVDIQHTTIRLAPDSALGTLADCHWSLRLSSADAPLLHFPWDWMYTASFPKKKAVTPAPHLRFDGEIRVGALAIPVKGWEGLRGHNWGREHAWTYAYGNCHLWSDGTRRTIDGFSAKIKLAGGVKSPWLSTVVSRNPDLTLNRPTSWFGGVEVTPLSWTLRRPSSTLSMRAVSHRMVGLRYAHPDGEESYCYNTKFADVEWTTPTGHYTSTLGELEVLTPEPVADIPLHPSPDWTQAQGDYRA